MSLFGTDGIINHITLIAGTVLTLGGFIFRKVVANDSLGYPFSVVGSSGLSILTFIIVDNIFNKIKWSVVSSFIVFMIAGFILGPLLWDGEAKE